MGKFLRYRLEQQSSTTLGRRKPARFATKKDYPTRTVRGLVSHTLVMWLSGTYLVLLWIVTTVVGHMLVSANLLISKVVLIGNENHSHLNHCY